MPSVEVAGWIAKVVLVLKLTMQGKVDGAGAETLCTLKRLGERHIPQPRFTEPIRVRTRQGLPQEVMSHLASDG